MRCAVRLGWLAAGLALLGLILGCGKFLPPPKAQVVQEAEPDEPDVDDLETIAEAFTEFYDEHNQGPKDQKEFFEYLKDEPTAQEALTSGRVVVHYGVTDERAPRGLADTVVAYEAKAPTQGGRVVMGDGEIQSVTAEVFKELPQPTPAKVH